MGAHVHRGVVCIVHVVHGGWLHIDIKDGQWALRMQIGWITRVSLHVCGW